MKVKINRGGQIRIPAALRWALGLRPGDDLCIELINGGHLLISRLVCRLPWGEVRRIDPDDPERTIWRLAVDRVAMRRRRSPPLPWNDPEQTYLKR